MRPKKKDIKKRKKLHYTQFWKKIVLASVLAMILTIVADLFYRDVLEQNGLSYTIDFLDIPISLVLIADVGLKYSDAKDKLHFVRHNIVLILSVLPISFLLLGLRLFKMLPVLSELPIIGEAVALEKVMKVQHGAKFMEAMREFIRFR